MKIKTDPFFPASEASLCSLPLASGNVKSAIVAPIAGGSGISPAAGRPLTATIALAIRSDAASKVKIRFFFITGNLLLLRKPIGEWRQRLTAAGERGKRAICVVSQTVTQYFELLCLNQ